MPILPISDLRIGLTLVIVSKLVLCTDIDQYKIYCKHPGVKCYKTTILVTLYNINKLDLQPFLNENQPESATEL